MIKTSVFIDESGVHKQIDHSTTAIVYVQTNHVNSISNRLEEINAQLKINSFHWAHHGWKLRMKYFKLVSYLDFTAKIALFNNPVKPDLMLETVFQHLITENNLHDVYIDGYKPKWYSRKLKKVLRDKGLSVSKLKAVRNEKSYPALQLADAIAGLSRYSYDYPTNNKARLLFNGLKQQNRIFVEFK